MEEGNLYSLGLEERDTLNIKLGGGIPKSSLALVVGGNGAGKSALAQRFTYGFLDCGYYVAYLTSELEVESFLKQMDSLNYNVDEHFLKLQLLLANADIESGEQYIKKIMRAKRIWNGDIIIFDSFDQYLRNDERYERLIQQNDEGQIAYELISFFRDLIPTGKTVMLFVDPTNLSKDILSPFKSVADIYFKLEMIDVGGQTRRLMRVKRFYGMGKQVDDSIGYTIRSNAGIVVESRGVV